MILFIKLLTTIMFVLSWLAHLWISAKRSSVLMCLIIVSPLPSFSFPIQSDKGGSCLCIPSWLVMFPPAHKGGYLRFYRRGIPLMVTRSWCGQTLFGYALCCVLHRCHWRHAITSFPWGGAVRSEDSWSSLSPMRMCSDLHGPHVCDKHWTTTHVQASQRI